MPGAQPTACKETDMPTQPASLPEPQVRDDVFSAFLEKRTLSEKNLLSKLSQWESREGEEVYANFLHLLTELEFDPNTAKSEWEKIIEHKTALSKKLGRNLDFRVAMLDYFINFNRKIRNPKIMEFNLFYKTSRMALMDDLTEAYNKRYFHIMLTREYNQAKRYRRLFSLMLIDIDNFKEINDGAGHQRGDEVLKACAAALRIHARKEDTVCRIGGDEFAVIMPETRPAEALLLPRRVLADRELHPRGAAAISFSGGIAGYPDNAGTADELVACADKLLYEAKAAGKRTVLIRPNAA
jgi:diguanylate cyclase (GGDEF)-like protein